MKKQMWISVAALLAVTVLVVVGATALLRSGPGQSASGHVQSGGAPLAQDELTEQCPVDPEESNAEGAVAPAGSRPNCPAAELGGVDMPCLGGNKPAGLIDAEQVVVASVWAWWCEPCREELPALQEFADAHPEYSVVGVHADKNAAGGVELLEDLGVSLPSYQDSANAFAADMGLPPVVPITVVFKGEEKIAVFPRPFTKASEIEQAVQEAL